MDAITMHFDPRAVRPVDGGILVTVESFKTPTHVQVIETRATVTVTIVGELHKTFRPRKWGRHELFVPLELPLTARRVIDGSNTTEQRPSRAA